jgi:dipeptidyl aminopeptidase/acylaminoacyl peptidase
MVEQTLRIRNSSGDEFGGDLRYCDEGKARPLLVVCHGFTAHKDWGPFPYFGRRFADLGFVSFVFNFSHNGIGRNPKRFTELEKFSRNTIGKELEDLKAVLDGVEGGGIGDGMVDRTRIGLVGHSRGGSVALMSASRDPRVRAVATWSAVSTFHRYTRHQKELWERDGFLPVTIRSMKTKLRYGIEVLRDLEVNGDRYDPVAAVGRLEVPLLIMHGEADVTVRPDEARTLFEAANKSRTELFIVEHTGHMYGAHAGSMLPNPTLEYLTEVTAKWFHRNL